MSQLGRQVQYGIGKETVAGTGVSATNWINQLSFDLAPKSEYVVNTSAWGRVERTNSATVLRNWAEGSLEAKLTDKTAGLILLGAFGSVASAVNDDASGVVYNHTMTINQNISGQSFTLVRKDALSTESFANARFSEWALSMELDDYIKYTSDLMALPGEDTTASPANTSENEFVPKHITVRTASNLAGLTSASAIGYVESFTLTVNPNLEIDWEAGSNVPAGFTSRGYEISFEMSCRYNDRTFEDAYKAGTELALQVVAENTDVTIGTSAHPKLAITAPKMNITDWSKKEEADDPISQTMTGTIHFDSANAYAVKAVLTSLQTSY